MTKIIFLRIIQNISYVGITYHINHDYNIGDRKSI